MTIFSSAALSVHESDVLTSIRDANIRLFIFKVDHICVILFTKTYMEIIDKSFHTSFHVFWSEAYNIIWFVVVIVLETMFLSWSSTKVILIWAQGTQISKNIPANWLQVQRAYGYKGCDSSNRNLQVKLPTDEQKCWLNYMFVVSNFKW